MNKVYRELFAEALMTDGVYPQSRALAEADSLLDIIDRMGYMIYVVEKLK